MNAPESGIDAATLTVALDVRHPLCFLALGPTRAFARARGLSVNWLPVEVPALRPPSPERDGDDRGVRHRRHRARMIAREIATYAEAQGRTIVDPYRDAPATAVHAGWLWVRARAAAALEPFLEAVFVDYWAGALDPADVVAVAARVDAVGADGGAFAAWAPEEGARASDVLARELDARGLAGAPLYRLGDELFLGRQHLPMIGWLLDGGAGPGPI